MMKDYCNKDDSNRLNELIRTFNDEQYNVSNT